MRAFRAVAAAVATVTFASCSSSTGAANGRQAVLDAYRQSWADLIAAGDPINPDAPELKIHRAKQALDVIVAVLNDYKSKGVVYRGTVELRPKIVKLDGDKATIRDCVFDHTETLDPKTNQIVKAAAVYPRWVTTKMEVVGGGWKAVTFTPEETQCAPGP
ncbi:MAG: hypothetical protein M3Z84_06385 [Actinomycetota bacterium]|nr:hypothetical protein [Actinomycetota bacterium]